MQYELGHLNEKDIDRITKEVKKKPMNVVYLGNHGNPNHIWNIEDFKYEMQQSLGD